MAIFSRNLSACLVVATLACACDSGKPGDLTPHAHSAAPAKPVSPDAARLRGMVNAVAANKASPVPVQVKFDLPAHPVVAQPVSIDLVVVPLNALVDRVSGKVEADDGLQVLDGAQIPPVDRPAEGMAINHTIKVLPTRDGIYVFRAVVTVESGGVASSETYSMPLIVGAGIPDLPAKGSKTAATQ
jgi:hypothetical protein